MPSRNDDAEHARLVDAERSRRFLANNRRWQELQYSIEVAPEHLRLEVLRTAALDARALVREGYVDAEHAVERVTRAATRAGIPTDVVQGILDQAFRGVA